MVGFIYLEDLKLHPTLSLRMKKVEVKEKGKDFFSVTGDVESFRKTKIKSINIVPWATVLGLNCGNF